MARVAVFLERGCRRLKKVNWLLPKVRVWWIQVITQKQKHRTQKPSFNATVLGGSLQRCWRRRERGLVTHLQDTEETSSLGERCYLWEEVFLMSKPASIYNTICWGMRLNSPSVSKEPGPGTCKDREGHCRARFCKISSCIWALLEVQAPKKKSWL